MKKRVCNERGSFMIRRAINRVLLGMALCATAVLAVPSVPQISGGMSYVEAAVESLSDNSIAKPPATGTNNNNNTSNNTETVTNNNDNGDSRIINDDDRADADEDLYYYMQSLEIRYHLDAKVMENLHNLFNSAVYYIANTDMTVAQLWSYVSSVKGQMESTAVANVTATTSEFLQVADNWQTPTVSAGQQVAIVLPIMNFGTEELNDLIVEPQTSTVVSEWPFEPDMTNYLQTEPFIPGNKTKEAAMQNRREFTFIFTVRSDVMTGYYPLKFNVSYTKAGIRSENPAELTVYVQTIGKPGSGFIGGSGQETTGSKPRIVVTAQKTNSYK